MLPSQKSALGIVRKYHPEVNLVVDATKPLTISVTEKDSAAGSKKNPNGCALAKACERSFDGAIISLSRAYMIKGRKAIRYQVPAAIARELVSFDRHQDFSPGEYTLGRITEWNQLKPRTSPQPKKKEPYGKIKSGRVHRTTGIRSL